MRSLTSSPPQAMEFGSFPSPWSWRLIIPLLVLMALGLEVGLRLWGEGVTWLWSLEGRGREPRGR